MKLHLTRVLLFYFIFFHICSKKKKVFCINIQFTHYCMSVSRAIIAELYPARDTFELN